MSSHRLHYLTLAVLISGFAIALTGIVLAQSNGTPPPDPLTRPAVRRLKKWTPAPQLVDAGFSPMSAQDTITITAEGFEGTFPGAGWDTATGHWGASSCQAKTGLKSAWVEGNGALACGSAYHDGEQSWMVYGPFNLSDATSAQLAFSYYLTSEQNFDYLFWGSAITSTFFGFEISGSSNGWTNQTFDLSDRTGESAAYIAFVWTADSSINRPVGAYVDDVVLTKTSGTGAFTYLPAIARNFCSESTFTDPGFASQPDMVQINADDAWRACVLSDPSIVVAIIDSGVDLDHPDLAANLIPGYDFIDNDAVPEDGDGHGSNVAGIAGAAINGVGVIGVGPKAHLLPVRVLDDTGSGTVSAVANGINYAANNAHILNLSLSAVSDISTVRNAISYAVNTRGRLVVAAAGNCGDPSTYFDNGCTYVDQPNYPAAYSSSYPNVMAVAAVDGSDQQASFSNENSYVTIAAPGVSIYNTYKNGGYVSASGTSQATPHVAGLAALIWARNPTYNATQVRQAIETTAVDLGSAGRDNKYGWGRIDVVPAVGLTGFPSYAVEPGVAGLELPPIDHRDAEFVPGRILIKFTRDVSAAGIAQALNAFDDVAVEGEIGQLDIRMLSVPVGQEWRLIDQLRALPGVEFAEPDYIIHLKPGPLTP